MAEEKKTRGKLWYFGWGLAGLVLLGILSMVYVNTAFPKIRCTAGVDHLEAEMDNTDCYTCHVKSTPKVAQDWYESKHGVMLVKCVVCHGQPDNKGAVPFSRNPAVETVCKKCHDPAIARMEAKFGLDLNCSQCHPYHNNSIHHDAYAANPTKTTIN